MKGKYMKKILAAVLLAGLIAGAAMAEAKPSMGKAPQLMASKAPSMPAKKRKKHRKHRRPAAKASSAKYGK
jgi:hypothetical protein